MRPVLDWSPIDPTDCPDRQDKSGFNDYWLTMGLWLRIRYAEGDRGSPEADRSEFRFILSYSLGTL